MAEAAVRTSVRTMKNGADTSGDDFVRAFNEIRAELVSRIGPPDEILAGTALEHAAELIVVGTHGHTGIARFLMGSVASSTIRHAPCDVLVVRGRSAKAAFERPLVATDFTPAASKAISHATWVCAPGTAIDALHAWHLPTGSWGATLLGQARFPWSEVRDAVVTSATARADRLVAEHAALGTAVRVALVQGPPTHAITHAAEDGHHGLIVVGSHGHCGVRRWLLGSVADATVRHASCSVLVVYSGA